LLHFRKDSKALYFVSQISELNLIESMLQHKQKSMSQEQTPKAVEATTHNLDGLFGATEKTETVSVDSNSEAAKATKPAKGGRYLDDVLFKMGDADEKATQKENIDAKGNIHGADDSFFADMMAQSKSKPKTKTSTTTTAAKPKTTTVVKAVTAKVTAAEVAAAKAKRQAQFVKSTRTQRANSATASTVSSKAKATKGSVTVKASASNAISSRPESNSDLVVEMLLGIQSTLHDMRADMRKLQSDVAFLKQNCKRK